MQTDETRAREVIQADRVAAWDFARFHCMPESQMRRRWFDGYYDKLPEGAAIRSFAKHRAAFAAPPAVESKPVPMILYCPKCHEQHVDEADEEAIANYDPLDVGVGVPWTNPPHRSHLCHACGCIWRPADVATEGVRSIKTAGDADTWGWDGASVKPTLHPSDREAIARVREAAKSVIDNAVSSYRSRGKDRYIEDESGERMMLVPHEDWALLQGALSPTPSAGRDDAGHPLARMVALDEEIEAEHPGWMTGQNTLPPATEKGETK